MIHRGAVRVGIRARGRSCNSSSSSSSSSNNNSGNGLAMATTKRHFQQRQQSRYLHKRQDQMKDLTKISAVIMGAPGSGKGTISCKILRDFDFAHISTGDLLRDEVQAGSEVGQAAKTFMDQGKFVPDRIIFDILVAAVERVKSQGKHIMLDGFPRSKHQAVALKSHLDVDVVMNLDVPRDVIVERLSDRWIHPASGRVYAYSYRPPKENGKDDETGDDLVRREDDQPEVVKQRLAKYEKTTRPLLKFYDAEGILHSFSGDKSDVIYENVKKFLREILSKKEECH